MSRLEEMDRMYGFIEADEFTIKMSDYRHLRSRVEELEYQVASHKMRANELENRVDDLKNRCTEIATESTAQEERLQKRNHRYKQALKVKHIEVYDNGFADICYEDGESMLVNNVHYMDAVAGGINGEDIGVKK